MFKRTIQSNHSLDLVIKIWIAFVFTLPINSVSAWEVNSGIAVWCLACARHTWYVQGTLGMCKAHVLDGQVLDSFCGQQSPCNQRGVVQIGFVLLS